jgi:hypothetical protein
MKTSFGWRVYHTLLEIYRRPAYILINLVSLAVYYYIFVYLIKIQEEGVFIATVPPYLVYLLVITSSIAFTIGIYSIRNTRRNEAKELSTGVGTVTALVGGVVGGCGCIEPLVLNLSIFGLNTSQTFALLDFISGAQGWLLWLMIVINSFVAIYYLNKLSKPACEIRRK